MKDAEMTFTASMFTVFLCVLFGGNGVAIKMGLTGLGPFTSAGIRFSLAAVLLFLWARLQQVQLGLNRKQVRQLSVICVLFTLQVACFHLGLARTTASHGALISNILPFMVLILAHFFIPDDRITWRKGVGVLLGFMGVAFLFMDEPDLNANLKTGDLIVLCAVMSWSLSAVYLKRIIEAFNPIQVTFYPMVFAVPFLFAGGMLFDDPMVVDITPLVANAIVFQALVTSSFGFVSWNTLLQRYGATSLYSFIFIIPVAGVAAGVILLDEPVTSHLLAAISFIVAGIMVVNIRRKKKPPVVPVQ
ncbi:MAG: DMT family transporter [Desulfobacteraceae bacterium]|nr:DMT family transporter [Desulfobacteraceae bacterium]